VKAVLEDAADVQVAAVEIVHPGVQGAADALAGALHVVVVVVGALETVTVGALVGVEDVLVHVGVHVPEVAAAPAQDAAAVALERVIHARRPALAHARQRAQLHARV